MTTTNQKTRFPWLRTLLLIVYAAAVIATVQYERASHEILTKAADLQQQHKYGAASVAYKLVVERYPLSLAVPEARAGLSAIEPAITNTEIPDRLRVTLLERLVSPKMDPYVADQLPVVGWTCSAAVLLVVFLTRFRRRAGWAMVALCCAALASFGSAVVLAISGLVPIKWAADILAVLGPVLVEPANIYIATWVLVGVAGILTLTPTAHKQANTQVHQVQPSEQPAAGRSGVTPTQPLQQGGVGARLQELDDLRSRELIAESEYHKERERILESI